MSFTTFNERGEDVNLFPFKIIEDEVEYLFVGVLDHLFARNVRKGFSGTGIKQTKEIVNFSDGSNC